MVGPGSWTHQGNLEVCKRDTEQEEQTQGEARRGACWRSQKTQWAATEQRVNKVPHNKCEIQGMSFRRVQRWRLDLEGNCTKKVFSKSGA